MQIAGGQRPAECLLPMLSNLTLLRDGYPMPVFGLLQLVNKSSFFQFPIHQPFFGVCEQRELDGIMMHHAGRFVQIKNWAIFRVARTAEGD